MAACYEPTVPDVRLKVWTYMRPNEAQEAPPEPLAALMYSLGMGQGDVSHFRIDPFLDSCRSMCLQEFLIYHGSTC